MASKQQKNKQVNEPAPSIVVVEAKDLPVAEQVDINKLIDQELEHEYPEHVKYPTSTGLLQCILRELIRQRIGR